jgi:hypothetical protein
LPEKTATAGNKKCRISYGNVKCRGKYGKIDRKQSNMQFLILIIASKNDNKPVKSRDYVIPAKYD